MLQRILVPTDGSELSLHAMWGAIELASRLGSLIVGVTVVEPYSYASISEYRPETVAEYEQRADQIARDRLGALQSAASAAGVPFERIVSRSFSPYESIIAAASQARCDAIFMASHGRRGLSALLLGSETQKVLTHSHLPVMVYR